MKRINLCAFCGEETKTFQNNLCSKCLRPSMKRGSATIDNLRPLTPKTNLIEINNFPEGAA
ncbi:hypothetical protein [Leptospira weilii]|uniref:Uncharacterized protein n=1 Tax=Leptospira weilii str. UI 13098 TaxID=1088542 RepID=M6QQV6_9LEPT|nr:hypothetical protein [Leptospira weilii]EMN91217.1 hypothetical protein LEP1GSC108_3288 [Leptospira weilii str. UI 13098]